jgi:amidase
MGKSLAFPVVRRALLFLAPLPLFAQQPRSSNATLPSGTWFIAQPVGADTSVFRFTLRFDRDSVIGANTDGLPIRGAVRGDSVTFEVLGRTDGTSVRFFGVAKNGAIHGMRVETPRDPSIPARSGEFLASPATPPRAPHLQVFEPKDFSRSFSGSVPPALHIIPGDTVRTWTLDNAGRDSTGALRGRAGNPLTGPFYIDGALPGDMIAIRLHRVRLNRDYAIAGDEIVGNALIPDYFRRIKEGSDFNARWRLDRERGLAMLEQPTSALATYTVPLRPMLGCVGVAPPAGQVIDARESGAFGGNMDFNEIREGVTLYLPVFQRGALLFLGDGHAVQGDGELTGDALETSMNIEFSVDVFPSNSTFRRRIGSPRAENDEYLMAIGISGDLSDALRAATTDFARWLERDYGLNGPEVAAVLGTSMRYQVAELVGSEVSIVAKIPKIVLRQLRRPTASRGSDAPTPQW